VIFRRFLAVAVLVFAAWVGLAADRAQGHRPFQVSFAPSTPHPGDVVRVDVEGADTGDKITATVLGQDIEFHFDPQQRKHRALVGIDLDTKPDAYRLHIHRNGTPETPASTLRVLPKEFAVRRLSVPGNFVEPPSDALEQIKRDSAMLAEAYARVSARKWTDAFILPVDGKPTSNFGTRSYYNGQRRSPHAGVDFVGKTGTPIRAANRGEIVVAAPMYFTGNTVVVDYGERLFSVFAHLSEIHVKTGDTVEPATVVGLVGATGRVTGPHLHWSVRLNGARVDPLSLVAATTGAP
jgi:murein DD-endopeptidase MepM/ murein hydrolase activator NlpD